MMVVYWWPLLGKIINYLSHRRLLDRLPPPPLLLPLLLPLFPPPVRRRCLEGCSLLPLLDFELSLRGRFLSELLRWLDDDDDDVFFFVVLGVLRSEEEDAEAPLERPRLRSFLFELEEPVSRSRLLVLSRSRLRLSVFEELVSRSRLRLSVFEELVSRSRLRPLLLLEDREDCSTGLFSRSRLRLLLLLPLDDDDDDDAGVRLEVELVFLSYISEDRPWLERWREDEDEDRRVESGFRKVDDDEEDFCLFFTTTSPFQLILFPSVVIIDLSVAWYLFAMTLKSSSWFVSLFVRCSFFARSISQLIVVIGNTSEIFWRTIRAFRVYM